MRARAAAGAAAALARRAARPRAAHAPPLHRRLRLGSGGRLNLHHVRTKSTKQTRLTLKIKLIPHDPILIIGSFLAFLISSQVIIEWYIVCV